MSVKVTNLLAKNDKIVLRVTRDEVCTSMRKKDNMANSIGVFKHELTIGDKILFKAKVVTKRLAKY